MSKSLVLWGLLVGISAYLGKYFMDLGVFRSIETKGIEQCRLIVPSDGEDQAFEDFEIDYDKGIAYMAGDDRTWWDKFQLPIEFDKKQGKVFMFDFQSELFQKLDIIDYPYEHFHPLGIGSLKGNHNQLFVANYRENDRKILGTVEIFQINTSNGNQLKFVDTVVHPLFTAPDDILVIDENTFYVTNVYHYRMDNSILLRNIEVVTRRPWTNVVLCSKSKTIGWECSIAIDSIIMANGIAASLDFKTVYVAASLEKRIRIYERHSENNSLTLIRSISTSFLVDNVFVNEHDQLIVAGHPNGILFALHAGNPQKYRAPSEVIFIRHPKSNSTFEHVLLTNGELLAGSTTGATYKQKLIIGAQFDKGILLCQGLF